MSRLILVEAIFLLEEFRFQQGSTGDCVTKCLNRAICNLHALKSEKVSDTEMAAMILEQFGLLFSEVPQIRRELERLAGL